MAKQQPSTLYLAPADLRVGIYVRLESGWTSHPFPFNNFLVKDEAQLLQLQRLGLQRVLCDPVRSNRDALQAVMMADQLREDISQEALEDSPPPEVPVDEVLEPAIAAKRKLVSRLSLQRKQLDACEKQFLASAREMSSISKNIFSEPEESVKRARSLVEGVMGTLSSLEEVHIHLMNNKLNASVVYDHGLNVTVLALILGRRMSFSPDELLNLGLGCVFHDIGKGEIPEKVSKKVGLLSNLERDMLQMHVDHGMTICRKLHLPRGALDVVGQHHEMGDGSGYPLGLSLSAISKPARVAALVNAFDNLCNPSNMVFGRTPHDALKMLFAHGRNHYDNEMLNTFIRAMGIYPPGTLVRLNTGLVAIVLSVNATLSLKPTVLVYESGVKRSEAIILDLEKEFGLAIERAISRDDLSMEAAAYLNPRRKVSFFPGEG